MKRFIKRLVPRGLFQRIEPAGHWVEALVLQLFASFPAKNLNIIGVTGTDGKTTTCTLIATMLRESGYKVAVMTTISSDFGDGLGEQPNPDHMTTPSTRQLIRNLERVKAAGVDWLVLETSSHALAQHRVLGVPYSIGVFTNLTHEHLDYHKTFERYRDAKRLLFKKVAKNSKGLQLGVINADDASSEFFIRDSKNVITYGQKSGDLRAQSIKLHGGGSRYKVETDGQQLHIECNVPGGFNIYNSLAAVGVGKALGLTKQQIEKGIAALHGVKGRMNLIKSPVGFNIYVDYAVTPAALETVLKTVKETTTGKVRLIFGATGDRDRLKRPIMGKIAAELADVIYLTDDETHTEDASSIRKAVFAGILEAGGKDKCREFDDRGEAIKQALSDAGAEDSIVITGLGHQTTRNMGGVDEPWSDTEFVVQKIGL